MNYMFEQEIVTLFHRFICETLWKKKKKVKYAACELKTCNRKEPFTVWNSFILQSSVWIYEYCDLLVSITQHWDSLFFRQVWKLFAFFFLLHTQRARSRGVTVDPWRVVSPYIWRYSVIHIFRWKANTHSEYLVTAKPSPLLMYVCYGNAPASVQRIEQIYNKCHWIPSYNLLRMAMQVFS